MDQSTTDLISGIFKLAINELGKAVEKGIRELGEEEKGSNPVYTKPDNGDVFIYTKGANRGLVAKWSDNYSENAVNDIRPVILKTNAEIEAILRENQ